MASSELQSKHAHLCPSMYKCIYSLTQALIGLCNKGLPTVTQVSLHIQQPTHVCSKVGSAMVWRWRDFGGLCINIQTSVQTHPAARSHHAVEEKGSECESTKKVNKTKWTLTVVFMLFSKLRWQMPSFSFTPCHCCQVRKQIQQVPTLANYFNGWLTLDNLNS